MVACFRYASIELYSVYLPPSKVEFDVCIQEWIQKEMDEVLNRFSSSSLSIDINDFFQFVLVYSVSD